MKTFIFSVVMFCAFAITSCGNSNKTNTTETVTETEIIEEVSTDVETETIDEVKSDTLVNEVETERETVE